MTDENGKSAHKQDELSRREWLVRLGETAAWLGFSAALGKAETGMVLQPGLARPGAAKLAPGLYEPSNDHLSHALSNDARFHPIPPGSETDYARPRLGPFQPQFFSSPEFQVIRRIVEIMLGEAPESFNGDSGRPAGNVVIADESAEWIDLTVSSAAGVREAARRLAPEHRILAVHYFGSKTLEEIEKNDPQKACREGLQWLENQSERRYGKPFLNLSHDQQLELLSLISDDRLDKTSEDAGTRFFASIKAGVIRGFYTSRDGLKELDYKGNAFYAESPGCKAASNGPNKAL